MLLGLSTKEKMFFARHMSVMSRAGIPTIEILSILKKQSSGRFTKILNEMIDGVKNGRFLSDTLDKYKNVFGEFFINLIRVGEVSGTLSENLEYLAESLRKKKELESKVRGAMIYPIIIFLATVGVSSILMFYIFPKILPVFRSMKTTLPITTRIFIFVSTFVVQHGLLIFVGAIVGGVGFWLLLKTRQVSWLWNSLLIRTPVIGTMIQQYNLVNYSRCMSLLLKSGVPIVEAVNVTMRTLHNPLYKASLKKIALQANQGDFISTHMMSNEVLFPIVFTQMLAVGERTGKLFETGIYLADYYEGELDTSTKSLSNILEPLMLIVMGGVVAFVALSIITPIYAYTSSLSK